MQSHSYENDFDLHENKTACRTHFHKKGFALSLVLKQRHKRIRKWPIGQPDSQSLYSFPLSLQGVGGRETLGTRLVIGKYFLPLPDLI